MRLDYPIIDLHTHLRNEIPTHSKIANDCGIDLVVYMANANPVLDNLEDIHESTSQPRSCIALPVAAITKGLEGRELVDIHGIRDYVVGFSDDGKYLYDLKLLEEVLDTGVLVMAHCSPNYNAGVINPDLETKYIKRYLEVLKQTGGALHIQHVSKKDSVIAIREAKEEGLKLTCETCPHYFTFTASELNVKVNPPLGNIEDVQAIRAGLKDKTIDVIASDYAPSPRETGIAGFRAFLPLSYGLVSSKVLTEEELREKLYLNPSDIINANAGKLMYERMD